MNQIDNYFANYSPEARQEYERIRKIVLEIAPKAEESISYGIPTFKVNKKPLLYFGAFKDHFSLFPATGGIEETIPELAPFKASKGTLHFTQKNNISDDLVRKFIQFRLQNL